MSRLAPDAKHQFGGISLDRSRPVSFRLDGRKIDAFVGDTVLSATLAAGIDTFGMFGDTPLGLGERSAPLINRKGGDALPMDRTPATDGAEFVTLGTRRGLPLGQPHSLRHEIEGAVEPPWLRLAPDTTLSADLVIVGGGVAGLAAAEHAADAGRSVIVVERRPWLGGDARFYGPVGDLEPPQTLEGRLIAKLKSLPNVTLLLGSEAFAVLGTTILAHQVEAEPLRGRIVALEGTRLILATGARQRLPVFAGNRLPRVVSAVDAYHLAKRYGVALGTGAVVATQSNFGYRLALRLHDAGIAIARIVDSRIGAQSRFIDFSKASGLQMATGQFPVSAGLRGRTLHLGFANTGSAKPALTVESDQLIVSGGFVPDLSLWMLAGGGVHLDDGQFRPVGQIDRTALAGSVAGYRSMRACVDSGRAAAALLFGDPSLTVEDIEIGAQFETPDGPTTVSPVTGAPPAFLDASSLVAATDAALFAARGLSLGDVAAAVDLGLISAGDAGAVAEERGAPGGDLVASDWRPAAKPVDPEPAWLAGRFGEHPARLHLIVDGKRVFEPGALVYRNTDQPDPQRAIGVIVEAATPGGIALVSQAALDTSDRFIVETLAGPSPARPKPA